MCDLMFIEKLILRLPDSTMHDNFNQDEHSDVYIEIKRGYIIL
jgi:hypothetical protein